MSDIESDGTCDPNAESHAAKGRIVSGTGKFAGLTGAWTHVNHQGSCKVSADRTTQSYRRRHTLLEPHTFRAIMILLYGAGLRISEALSLWVSDVDLSHSLLLI